MRNPTGVTSRRQHIHLLSGREPRRSDGAVRMAHPNLQYNDIARLGQRVLLECWGSVQHWLASISGTMDIITQVAWDLSDQERFEFPG